MTPSRIAPQPDAGTDSSATETTAIPPPASRETQVIDPPHRIVLPQPGDRIGSYLLQTLLGTGVSCHVFRAWDEAHGCPVAVKIVNWSNVCDREAALRQMRTEAAALARVKHPRVLNFIDFGHDPRWPYLVTEFVEGRPLGELIRGGGPLPLDWTLHLFRQIVDGLGAVWQAGIVHRDVKPDNILVSASGVAKLIDFGVAKCGTASETDLAGTAAYLAPEQAKNAAAADSRSDIYSLGASFFEALTGKLPFEARNRAQMIFQHISQPAPSPAKLNPALPQLVCDLCLWMLMKDPQDRPQNHQDLRDAFRSVATPG